MRFNSGVVGRLVGRAGGKAGTAVLAVVVLAASAGFGLRGAIIDNAGTDPLAAIEVPQPACAGDDATVTALHDRLVAGPLGEGTTAYPGAPVAETVESQAVMLMAEVLCVRRSPDRDRTTMNALGDRLLTWPARHGGAAGWGVAVPWDAFGDGTTNPAGTVYAVPTALAVRALLDWADVADLASAAKVYPAVDAALAAWLAPAATAPGGLVTFSLDPHDADRGLYAPSLLLAGQLQRFARVRFSDRAPAYAARADAVVEAALPKRRTDRAGNWYWPVSPVDDTANDIEQAGYLVDGLVNYDRYAGRHTDDVSVGGVERHLLAFGTGGTGPDPLRRVPAWQAARGDGADQRLRPRDLGWTMFVASFDRGQLGDLVEPLCSQSGRYRDARGRVTAQPVDGAESSAPEVYDDVAYQYLGLVALGADACRKGPGAFADVPFVEFATGAARLGLQLDVSTLRARLVTDGRILSLPGAVVPLSAYEDGPRTVAVVRTLPTGALAFVTWNRDTAPGSTALPAQGDAALTLRASVRSGDALYLVVHDARTGALRLQRYRWSTLALDREWPLPALDGGEGATNADGRVLPVVAADGHLEVIGGTLRATLRGDELTSARLDGCDAALEAVADGAGAAVLCRTPAPGYAVVAAAGGSTAVTTRGVPYALRVDPAKGGLAWSDAADDVAAWFEFELRHTDNGGTAELGVSNRDGRVAHVQLPYLDALLDAAALGRRQPPDTRLTAVTLAALRRLVVEVSLLDRVVGGDGYADRSRSTDGSRQLRADEVAPLVLGLSRYRGEVDGLPNLLALDDLAAKLGDLDGYAEAVERGAGDAGRAVLGWPKGRAVPLDGGTVPYATQNAWAQAVLLTRNAGTPAADAARDVLGLFYDRVAVPAGGALPADGRWPAAFGRTAAGWSASDAVSTNQPAFPGDASAASLAARTVDARAMVGWSTALRGDDGERLRTSAWTLVTTGVVQPRLAGPLAVFGELPTMDRATSLRFGRAATTSGLGDALWANLLASA